MRLIEYTEPDKEGKLILGSSHRDSIISYIIINYAGIIKWRNCIKRTGSLYSDPNQTIFNNSEGPYPYLQIKQ